MRETSRYRLEIYLPGACQNDGVAALFESDQPFLTIQRGDLLNRRTWGKNAMALAEDAEWTLLRVVTVEHLLWSQKGGECIHQIMVFTEAVSDTAEMRFGDA